MTADTPADTTFRLAIFPLAGAVLFPGLHLPLHIFEPRYRAMVQDVLIRTRQIGMIQPLPAALGAGADAPPLHAIGTVGRIVDVETLDDGRFNLVLEGVGRFRLLSERTVDTPFRQVDAAWIDPPADTAPLEVLASTERAALESAARRFADSQGYVVDWASVTALDDAMLVNGIAQVAPFDAGAKQALLEADGIAARAALAMDLMDFYGRLGGDEGGVSLQ